MLIKEDSSVSFYPLETLLRQLLGEGMLTLPPLDRIAPSLRFEGGMISLESVHCYRLVRAWLSASTVDSNWYLSQYPDVSQQIDDNVITSALEHYVSSGYAEGRMPFPVQVDERWYFEAYPDLTSAKQRGEIIDAYTHFVESGYKEGRLPHRPVLDEKWYARTYPEALKAVERQEFTSLEDHFIRQGYLHGFLPQRPAARIEPDRVGSNGRKRPVLSTR